uniref:DNA topoisomerase 2 n=1 Tax=Pithovirus LCPAC104 TaxID=2506589 RepID=A0A481Z4J9_9VIRU|nr:MAG: DNA topoisomerase II [Pithovirus LCPAC104]
MNGKSFNIEYKPENYKKHKLDQHIYEVPDTYIGSDVKNIREERIFSLKDNIFLNENIHWPEGCERLFLEILSNAGDNIQRSRENNVDIGTIIVNISENNKKISIRNNGIPIPIKKHPIENVYVPEMIFGMLLTSSNYDQEEIKRVSGRNGYGSKLTNIFSKYFSVKIGDSNNKLEYFQEWSDNMKIMSEPKINEYDGVSYVEISYIMDFKRFKYSENDGYPEEAINLYAKHCVDISFTCKIPVIFNGINFNYKDIKKYAKLFYDEDTIKKSIFHSQYTADIDNFLSKTPRKENSLPMVEIFIADTPDSSTELSYVNGILTKDGGVHIDSAFKQIIETIMNIINNPSERNSGDKDKKNNQKLKSTINKNDVRRHLSIIISCRLTNPKFTSQMKSKLTSPTPKISFSENDLNKLSKWNIIYRLQMELEVKKMKNLSRTNGRKIKHINLKNAEDANWAGTDKSNLCTLYITEGISAMGYATKIISFIEDGRNMIGVFPMKGKPLNIMNAPAEQIIENKEITELKQILGLKEDIDYLLKENFNSLRYGHVVILADSDVDGKHIIGLILNIFYCRYITLLYRGYIKYLKTPIIRISKGRSSKKFFGEIDYEKWKNNNAIDYLTWIHRYLKGLGTSTDEDIEEDFSDPRYVNCSYDDKSGDYFNLAFNEKLADNRKEWIESYEKKLNIEYYSKQSISNFIDNELIEHSIANIIRTIPSYDGLKLSQRQIIWCSMLRKSKKLSEKNIKVAGLAASSVELVNYHHGENSMCETIISMAHNFVGSNNLSYFVQQGQFGTRNKNGEDAAKPRYIYTSPEWWWSYIFKKEDNPLLEIVIDEGKPCQPELLLPIIPLGLVNGCRGIGTGYSTYIPSYKPLDLIEWITKKIKLKDTNYDLIPWFRGFKGNVEIDNFIIPVMSNEKIQEENSKISEIDDRILEPDEENMNGQIFSTLTTKGLFEKENKKIIVTELPIGRCMHKYNQWLSNLKERRIIIDFNNLSKHDTAKFEIYGIKNPTLKSLRLVRKFGLTNMYILDPYKKPKKFSNTKEILEVWYQWRLPYYSKRKQNIIKKIENIIVNLSNKYKFIKAVIDKELIIMERKKAIIHKDMESLKIPKDLLNTTTTVAFTEEELEKLKKEIEKEKEKLNEIINITSEKLWLEDLEDFKKEYKKHFKN